MPDQAEQPNMPKVIPSVWISLVDAILGVATAAGLPISDALSASIITLAGVLAAVLPALDVWLRRARLTYLTDQRGDHTGTTSTTVINNPTQETNR